MQMSNSFASVGAVIDHEAKAAGEAEFAGDGAGGEQEVAEDRLLVGRGLADAGNDRLGDDEQVDGSLRGDVVDDDAELVLVFDFGGDFAGDDAFEEGGHGGGPRSAAHRMSNDE